MDGLGVGIESCRVSLSSMSFERMTQLIVFLMRRKPRRAPVLLWQYQKSQLLLCACVRACVRVSE